MDLKWNDSGLIPAIAQDRLTGEIRMLAWMNQEALGATAESGYATFFSRSRAALWQKGETSGNRLKVVRIEVDCDADSLLLLVDPEGPSCHTGRESCFFRAETGAEVPRAPYLVELEQVIRARSESSAESSYTRTLLDGGAERVGGKLREEADELARALATETDDRVASEAADLLFHMCVGLRLRGLSIRAVLDELARRAGQSGHAEKAARAPR